MEKRKRRSDRTHIVYRLTNTSTGETYIGITVSTGRAYKRSLTERWKRHVSRAMYQSHDWSICRSNTGVGSRGLLSRDHLIGTG